MPKIEVFTREVEFSSSIQVGKVGGAFAQLNTHINKILYMYRDQIP